MRIHLLGLALMAGVAMPSPAQRDEPIDRRVTRLEQELRAVQRRVFPNGTAQFVEPEIGAQPAPGPGGNVSGDALASLAARVDALEAQLRTLTGQAEEANHRSQDVADQIARLRADLGGRLDRLEAAPRPLPPEPAAAAPARNAPSRPEPAAAEPAEAAVPGDAEAAYNVGFRLWDQHHYAEAATALDAAATRFPDTRWTSWMRNLEGRAYLDDNKPATAARVLLANYQDNPHGERAADSLYYLGQALNRLNRRAEACRV
jgi:TolA-binding protein